MSDVKKLRKLVRDRNRAALRRRAIDAQIAEEVKTLQGEGYAMASLAEVVGVSRQGLYDILARAEERKVGPNPLESQGLGRR